MREKQRRDTAARVVTTAEELFLRRGFAETTIRDIATACGVSVGTVMSVGDKNALLVAGFDRSIGRIHDNRAEGAGGEEGVTCAERIAELFDPFVGLFMGRPLLARNYASILVAGNHGSVVLTELSRLLVNEMGAVLERFGRVDEERAARLAESIYFAYIGRLFTWSADDRDEGGLRRSLRRIVEEICRGVEVRA